MGDDGGLAAAMFCEAEEDGNAAAAALCPKPSDPSPSWNGSG